MDKRLILAVAGSGKTTHILNQLRPDRRSLILTFTRQNLVSLDQSIRERHGGIIPPNVEIQTYFSFLYSFCIRPYFSYRLRDKGLLFGPIPARYVRTSKQSREHYLTSGRYIYAARAAKMIDVFGMLPDVVRRLGLFFDDLFVDEVQDFASNDFNFLLRLADADVRCLCVGDYFQHTYDTSRDGATRSGLHKNGLDPYVAIFKDAGFDVDRSTLLNSHRCSPDVCSFISNEIGIEIGSARTDRTDVRWIKDEAEARRVLVDNSIVKLFYKQHRDYACYSNNWGNSKGLNLYRDVCVVLNPTSFRLLSNGQGKDLKPDTKNKIYVACSRAKRNLYFVEQNLLKRIL